VTFAFTTNQRFKTMTFPHQAAKLRMVHASDVCML